MSTWPVQDAKARLSELLKASLTQGPQVVTYHGARAAVLLAVAEWERLKRHEPTGLKALLLAPSGKFDSRPDPVLERDQASAFVTRKRGSLRRRTPAAI